MSYCRFSSDDFGCDLYCYEDCSGGWTTHVAGNRIVGNIPKLGTLEQMLNDRDAWMHMYRAQMDFLNTASREEIGLAYDGATFNDPTLLAFRERLLMLRKEGYRFPDYVIEQVDEELAQEQPA